MNIKRNYSLKRLNSLALDVSTNYFIEINSENDVHEFINRKELKNNELLILGGGNNILFSKNFLGVVIYQNIKHRSVEFENEEYTIVKVGAAEDWDEFVEWSVSNGLSGLENLSNIPGTVGASPIQNIGAYGAEVKNCIDKIETICLKTGKHLTFSNSDCEFSYRSSIFKEKYKNKYLITYVYFKLNRYPDFKIHYGDIKIELENFNVLNLQNLRQAIINIRDSKLPNPKIIPNVGSFFKNPIVNKFKLEELKNKYPKIISYIIDENKYKLAAGWLIDYLGWKGKVLHNAGVHEKQALVLINKSNATGVEIINLANKIKKSVLDNFGIELEFEVNIV